MEAQERGVWPEDFGASTSTSRMRDVARRRREAEEKLAQHLFATEPQLRPAEPPSGAVPESPVHASEHHIHEHHIHGQHPHESHAPAASEGPTAPVGPANTPE